MHKSDVDFCHGVDPYSLSASLAKESLPRNVGYFDICNYCIDSDSAHTKESLQNFRENHLGFFPILCPLSYVEINFSVRNLKTFLSSNL